MRITNLNPDTDIGASAWLLELDDHRLLMDAGMHPKRDGRAALPLYSAAENQDVDAIAISHCHHDHLGSLPVAMRHFPTAHVLMTELSHAIAGRVLHNSVNVMIRQREEQMIKEMMLEGVISILEGMNPRMIETKLRTFLFDSKPDKPAEVIAA